MDSAKSHIRYVDGAKSRIVTAWLLPHPPIAVPEVGGSGEREIARTVSAYHSAADAILARGARTLIVISPHAPVSDVPGELLVRGDARMTGDLRQFGAEQASVEYEGDGELAVKIAEEAAASGLAASAIANGDSAAMKPHSARARRGLDHGTVVPLRLFERTFRESGLPRPKLVVISVAALGNAELFAFGGCVARAANKLARDCALIASGDLSHRLKHEGPYGFDPAGPEFDRHILGCMRSGDVSRMLETDADFLDRAAQCGFYGILMTYGALMATGASAPAARVHSYEGPFGVGYGAAEFLTGCVDAGSMAPDSEGEATGADAADPYVELAKAAIRAHVGRGERLALPGGLYDALGGRAAAAKYRLDQLLSGRAGVFVSIKKRGALRGCIGTIGAARASIADEIVENAISACSRDPRFPPVGPRELSELTVSVDVLSDAEPVSALSELDAGRYGVIVSRGYRRGLLLPNLEGVDTVEAQLAIALDKAGIRHTEDYAIERFEIVRHERGGAMRVTGFRTGNSALDGFGGRAGDGDPVAKDGAAGVLGA